MRLTGRFLVEPRLPLPAEATFQRLSSPIDHDRAARVIVVRGLNPNYLLLFDHIDLIVTRFGSRLSHLAILAREHSIPIFQTDDDIASIPRDGTLRIDGDAIEIAAEQR